MTKRDEQKYANYILRPSPKTSAYVDNIKVCKGYYGLVLHLEVSFPSFEQKIKEIAKELLRFQAISFGRPKLFPFVMLNGVCKCSTLRELSYFGKSHLAGGRHA